MIYNKSSEIIKSIFFCLIFLFTNKIDAQGVGIGTSAPNSSALLDLDVSSLANNNKKGVLLPRVALKSKTDITTISDPAIGLLVYNTTMSATDNSIIANTFYYWNGTNWTDISSSEVIRSTLYMQLFIVGNTGTQTLNKNIFNNGTPIVVSFDSTATGAMSINIGDKVSLSNNNFKILSSGNYEITGYVGYNPWIQTSCATYTTENNCVAALDFVLQRSADNGSTWTQIAKSSTSWGVGTGDKNRSVIVAPFVVALNGNDLVRALIIKGSSTNHGVNPSSNPLNIEAGTGLSYSRLLRFQKIN